jgi:Tfp pilus assembly protein FimT
MFARLCSRTRGVSADAGATLVEAMVVVAMIGTLTAMAVWGIRGWATANAFKGASQQIQSVMRSAQQRAITEGTSFCVWFDTGSDTYATYRSVCNGQPAAALKTAGPWGLGSSAVHLSGPAFVDPLSATQHGVTFLPRGSAWPGQVSVVRDGSLTKVVHVEGMTGRVSAG